MKIKKFTTYILILIVLFGLFSPMFQVNASVVDPNESCNSTLTNQPCQSSTQACAPGLSNVLCRINYFLSAVLPLLVSLGVLYFIWGVAQYFIRDSEEAKKKGRDRIIFGIIGLAIIISMWGLVYILTDTFGVTNESAPDVSNLVASPASSCSDLIDNPKFQDLLNYATCIIGKSIIPLIVSVAVLMFIWGAVNSFIINADEEAKRSQGKQFMIWGIIALAVMVSVWGLVGILGDTFGLNTSFLPQVRE